MRSQSRKGKTAVAARATERAMVPKSANTRSVAKGSGKAKLRLEPKETFSVAGPGPGACAKAGEGEEEGRWTGVEVGAEARTRAGVRVEPKTEAGPVPLPAMTLTQPSTSAGARALIPAAHAKKSKVKRVSKGKGPVNKTAKESGAVAAETADAGGVGAAAPGAVGSFKTPSFNPITNCSNCGSLKVMNRTSEQCICTCGIYFCTLNLCPYETKDGARVMFDHRRRHRTHKDVPVDYTTNCKCGAVKMPVPGATSWKCTNTRCPLIHCLHPNCFMWYRYNTYAWNCHNAEKHTVLVPENQRDTLCSCGQAKVRIPIGRRPGVGQCRKCKIYWCIKGTCRFERFSLASTTNHSNSCP